MYYEPQSGMYFSYDAVTQTHQYHEGVSAAKFSLLTHIIYNRRQPTHSTEKSHKLHKVGAVLMCLIHRKSFHTLSSFRKLTNYFHTVICKYCWSFSLRH